MTNIGHNGTLSPAAGRMIEDVDASSYGDPAPISRLLILHAKPDVGGDRRNVCLDYRWFSVKHDDICDGIDWRG